MAVVSSWFKISILLSVFGFVKEFRPSEPYIFEYLTSKQWYNFTENIVMRDIYPVGTYSYIILLIVVFLITDYCRYKPLITLCTLAGIVVWSMLIWSQTLLEVQILEVFYGFFMASEIAYYTYIYAKVPKEFYQIVTSITRVAILVGRFMSAVIGQCLIYFHLLDMKQLNYVTLSAMIIGTLWSLIIPSVPRSLYFNQPETLDLSVSSKTNYAFKLLWQHTKISYTNVKVIKWSIWWAMATCGFLQVESYIQPLWQTIADNNFTNNTTVEQKNIYNGAVTATLTILGAGMAMLVGMLNINWNKYGELALTLCSTIGGCALIICARTTSIWICYIGYIVFGVLYQMMITVANCQVASDIPEDSYGLIFGINTLLALLFQIFLIQVFVSEEGFAFEPSEQYLAYGGYHIFIGFIFFIFIIINFIIDYLNRKPIVRESIVNNTQIDTD